MRLDDFDVSPRSAKRRKLDEREDGPSASASSLHHGPNHSPTTTVKQGRRRITPANQEFDLSSLHDAINARGNGTQDTPRSSPARRSPGNTLGEETNPERLNGFAINTTPSKRPRGRPRKSAAPSADLRLSDLIHSGDEGDNKHDSMRSTPASARQSGRERRPPKRFLEQLSPTRTEATTNGSTPAKRRKVQATLREEPTHSVQIVTNGQAGSTPSPAENGDPDQQAGPTAASKEAPANEQSRNGDHVEIPIKRKRGRPRKADQRKDAAAESKEQAVEESRPEPDRVPAANKSPGLAGLFGNVFQNQESEVVAGPVRRIILEKLTGKRRNRLVGLEEEYRKVHQVVQQTVAAGEGNSLLVIGARGTGKTTVRPSLPLCRGSHGLNVTSLWRR